MEIVLYDNGWLVHDKVYASRAQCNEPETAQLEREHAPLHPFLPDL